MTSIVLRSPHGYPDRCWLLERRLWPLVGEVGDYLCVAKVLWHSGFTVEFREIWVFLKEEIWDVCRKYLFSWKYITSKEHFIIKLSSSYLTHSCLGIYLTSVIWAFQTYQNNFPMKHIFTKYLKEGCR